MRPLTLGTIAVILLQVGCGSDELPSRDHIPALRNRLQALEQAVKSRSPAAVDSLLSVDILDIEQGSDSLLLFIYGPDGRFPFEHLGDYTIFYSEKLALIDCFVMDAGRRSDRPMRLYLKQTDGAWLFTRFEPGPAGSDTARDETNEP